MNYEHAETLLSVKDLVIRFTLRGKELTAIRGVSLDLYKGESLAIVGESGSEKSVFTKSFMGCWTVTVALMAVRFFINARIWPNLKPKRNV